MLFSLLANFERRSKRLLRPFPYVEKNRAVYNETQPAARQAEPRRKITVE